MSKRKKRQPDQKKLLTPARQLIGLVMLFFFLGFLLLAAWMQSEGTAGWEKAVVLAVAVPSLIYVGVLGIPRLFPGDRLLLSLTNFLCALGVLVLFRLNPDRGISQAFNYFAGVVAMLGCAVVFRFIRRWKLWVALLMLVSVGLLALPLIYGSEINGAQNWVTLFGFGFQPSELVKISLLVAVCWLLSERKAVLAIGLTGVSLGLPMLQKDLGTALLYYGTVLTALWAATGSGLLLLGEGIGFALFFRDFMGSEWEGRIQNTLENVYATVFVYFECMLAGAVICGITAAKKQPAMDKDFIIILGCWFRKDGTLPPLLRGRVDRALAFWRQQKEETGKEAILIPSGGQGKDESMPEAEAMRRYLVSQGIPESMIRAETQSKNTYENMTFSKAIIEEIKAEGKPLFATTNYHVFRSGVWANQAGLHAEGIGGKTKWWFWPNAFMRECVGLMKRRWKQEILLLIALMAFFGALSMVLG